MNCVGRNLNAMGECDRYEIGEAEIAERLAFFGLGPDRDRSVAQLNDIIAPRVDAIIDEFYAYLMGVPALRQLLADGLKLGRLRETQRAYILTLGQDRTRRDYFERRLQIGRAHERVGLAPMYYLGAYAKLFELITRCVHANAPGNDVCDIIVTLERLFSLDTELALMTYHGRQQDAIVESVRYDPVTAIAARGFALEALAREHDRAARFGRPFSIIFVDVDHFKALNDNEGHAAGDAALAEFAGCLRAGVRPQDLVGRYGGDEFLVGVVEGGALAAARVAERIRASVEARFKNRLHPLTASIGVAEAHPSEPLAALIQRADGAMYQAKSAGKNNIVTADGVAGTGKTPTGPLHPADGKASPTT